MGSVPLLFLLANPRLHPTLPPHSRTGLPAIKVGMTQAWTAAGTRLPLTVLWLDAPIVTHVKSTPTDTVNALQISCGAVRAKNAHGRTAGHCAAAALQWTARHAAEFRVTPDAVVPLGTPLSAAHFTPGQYVDITGTSIGKGFQGVMKRWGFGGQPASHGTSKAHRSAGGIGGCQDPGKVWRGKKMAGRMGGVTRTAQSLFVYRVSCGGGLVGERKGGMVWKGGDTVFVFDFFFLILPSHPHNHSHRSTPPATSSTSRAPSRGMPGPWCAWRTPPSNALAASQWPARFPRGWGRRRRGWRCATRQRSGRVGVR